MFRPRAAPALPSAFAAASDAATARRVRRGNIFGYAYLVTPGIAIVALALQDALATSRWLGFAAIAAIVIVFLFAIPLFGHFRCGNCKSFFRQQRQGLAGRETVYRCTACGRTARLAEWCSLGEVMKAGKKPPAE